MQRLSDSDFLSLEAPPKHQPLPGDPPEPQEGSRLHHSLFEVGEDFNTANSLGVFVLGNFRLSCVRPQ